jgi:HD superfamily phosphohydrolase YqeK
MVAIGLLTRIIAGIPVPNTAIVNASIAYAHDNLPELTYNHVMRAWLNGQAIINKLPAANLSNVDQEGFAVAAILHDMGWSVADNQSDSVPKNQEILTPSRSDNPEIRSADKRFEVDGANAG